MIAKKMQEMLSGSSAIRAMFTEGKRQAALYGPENVFDYSLGNPNVPAPDAVRRAAVDLLEQEDSLTLHGYTANSGIEMVRDAIASHLNGRYGGQLSAKHIVMTVGAAGGLNVILKTLLDPGDKVAVFTPYFGEYKNYVENFGAQLIEVPTDPETFLPDLPALVRALGQPVKTVIVNTPNNPTGVVYPRALLEKLSDILREKGKEQGSPIYLISDEPYREIVYDGRKVCWLPDLYEHTIVCYSYSKSLSLPGERIGYLVIPPDCADSHDVAAAAGIATRILGFVNAPALQQRIVQACLNQSCDVEYYRRNKDTLYDALTSFGYDCVKPQGAFYLFVRSPIPDDRAFCEQARKKHLLLVPGSAFGAPGYVRLAYCVTHEMILRSLPVFRELMDELGGGS